MEELTNTYKQRTKTVNVGGFLVFRFKESHYVPFGFVRSVNFKERVELKNELN